MKCENCQSEHFGQYGSGRFCSSKCARCYSTKEKRKIISSKVSDTLSRKYRNGEIKLPFQYLDPERVKEIVKRTTQKIKEDAKKKIMESNFEELSYERKRKRIIWEQDEKCNKCKNSHWLDSPISFEIEHKDGNRYNHVRENMEALCPNCHSLTHTWRGRNNRKSSNSFSDDEILQRLIKFNFNRSQTLRDMGYADKGGNYRRINRLIKEYKAMEAT